MTSGDSNLLQQAAALPKEIEPERDLWPSIESRLEARPNDPVADPAAAAASSPSSWQASLAVAAGLVLALSVGFWIGNDTSAPAEGPALTASTIEQLSPAPANGPAALPVSQTLTADLHRTRVALSGEIEAALDNLPEDTRVVVRGNLATINEAFEEIDRVLGQAPDSALDQQLLMTMYADQLALLGSMQRLIRTANSDMKQEILL